MKKRLSLLLAAVMLCCVSALAHNVPDLTKDGSIHVTMRCEGEEVPGGTLTLYRVGEVQEESDNFSFRLTEDFAGSEAALDKLDAALASALKNYARDEDLEGVTADIDREGRAAFTGLKAGLYLLVQEKAAPGYYKADPFLVTLPMAEDGEYVYDVDASPKVEEKPDRPDKPDEPKEPHKPDQPKEPEKPIPPDKPDQPTEPDAPPKEPDQPPVVEIPDTPPPLAPTLPQTGQLNWPVPVLAVLGMALLALGFLVKRSGYEK